MPFDGIATYSLDRHVHDMGCYGRCILPSCMLGKFTAGLAISLLCLLHGKLDATIWKSSISCEMIGNLRGLIPWACLTGRIPRISHPSQKQLSQKLRVRIMLRYYRHYCRSSQQGKTFPMNKDALRSLTGISLFRCNCKESLFGVLISDTSFSCVSQFSASWWKVIKPLCYNT